VELEAEELRRLAAWQDHGLARVQLETPRGKILLDPRAPACQYGGLIVKQRKVVDVADIRRTQHLRDEMIKAVEIKVGEELTGQIPDREAAAALER
jgi:hypothetical protein